MKLSIGLFLLSVGETLRGTLGQSQDIFNYDSTSGRDYGPQDWDEVSCNNLSTCPGWPNKLEGSVGWSLNRNQCRWCPIEGNNCGQHRQSPIDLQRDRAIADHENWKECPDWHWMMYRDGTCTWDDMLDQFEISRHGLQMHTPLRSNGDIDCVNENGQRKFPRLDYSKGFPDWWHLSRTDIKVPSEHVQQGQRYAAEVHLAHFYEIDHYKNKLGKVSLFMQDYEGEAPWHFLDKLICQWRRVEEEKRAACDLPPAPVYKMCELYRGQERSEDDFDFPTESGNRYPTHAPLVAPDPIPIDRVGSDPPDWRLPLHLCQGDCDFATDCAPGLICHRRDAWESVPGCIGGESDGTNTDYCVFDPYGGGYVVPTAQPTIAPTATAQPSLTPLPPRPRTNYGGTPPFDKFPLQYCEGDCDNDDQCAEGLICFQRSEFEPIPGCIGGEIDATKTDFCILDPYGPGYELPPTDVPTTYPSRAPTEVPTPAPQSEQPSANPSDQPVVATFPTPTPTANPTDLPSAQPSAGPSEVLSDEPTLPLVPSTQPSYVPRPIGPPKELLNLGWEPPTPLGECEGDCDEDADCGPGMYCFQRNALRTPVPGCAGGAEDLTLADYCTFREIPGMVTAAPSTSVPTETRSKEPSPEPTQSPSDQPTGTETMTPTARSETPSSSPTGHHSSSPTITSSAPPTVTSSAPPTATSSAPPTISSSSAPTISDMEDQNGTGGGVLPSVNFTGWSPPLPLGLCMGDCDRDSDCAGDMVCFQRNDVYVPVPGCIGGDEDGDLTDYCILPQTDDGDRVDDPPPNTAITSFPSMTPTFQAPPPKPIVDKGWSPETPLGLCEGDCDVDSDCAYGLKCFQRYMPNTDIPGCIGGEQDGELTDYCIFDPSAPPRITSMPSAATSSQPTTSPSAAPSASPSKGPTSSPSKSPTAKPTASPTKAPTPFPTKFPSPKPTDAPTPVPSPAPSKATLAPIDCDAYNDVNFFRMCKEDSCCSNPRSSSSFCHESYALLGDAVASACHTCCLEEQGVTREVGPDNAVNADIPKTVPCEQLENPERMCKADSCCDGVGSDWCSSQEDLWPGGLGSICWYCCFPSKDVETRRELSDGLPANHHAKVASDTSGYPDQANQAEGNKKTATSTTVTAKKTKASDEEVPTMIDQALMVEELRKFHKNRTAEIGPNDRVTHDISGRKIIVRAENFEEKGAEDEEAYFEEMHAAYRRRAQANAAQENYEDVYWWPYEWMLKVGTEYYFRYEGTQTVPPCYDTAHWRVMKDPIRVAPHQMRELERLIAWRLGDNSCSVDTAGKSEGNPDYVDVARPVQSYHKLHRKVFCECQDWASKFPQDRNWCRNWRHRPPEQRLFENPYNWPSNGFDVSS